MSRKLDVQVAKILGQSEPPTLKKNYATGEEDYWDWNSQHEDGTWTGNHWFDSRSWQEVDWPKHYSTNWSAMRELVQLARCGFGGHAAAVVEITVFDSIPPNDCVCRIWGPDLWGAMVWGDEVPEVVSRAFVKAYEKEGKDERIG